MDKTVILVGCGETDGIFRIMHNISYELETKHVPVLSRYFQGSRHTMETANCRIYFVTPRSIVQDIRADAVFGEESFKPILWLYCKPDADRAPTMDLVTYICHIEHICECIMYNPGISFKELSEGVRVMERIGKKRLIQKFADECDSESERHLELGRAFAEGFEAGVKYVEVKTCTRSHSDLATAIEKAVREEAKKAIDLEIMRFGTNKNKTTLTPEAVHEIFEKARNNGVVKPSIKSEDFLIKNLHIPANFEIKKMDLESMYPKVPSYLAQQQIYLSMCRNNGKTALKNAFHEYCDYLISEKMKKCAEEYCRKDAKMTDFVFKNSQGLKPTLPEIKNVVFNNPATIVMWADGTKTVVKCQDGDIYDPEKGLAMAISKKIMGNAGNYYDIFNYWLKKYKKPEPVKTHKPTTAKFDALSSLAFGNKKENE